MDRKPFKQAPLLVTDDELLELERIGYPIRRSAGVPFFLEGELGDFAVLIRKGHVKVTRGDPPRIIDVRGPGAVVGELAVKFGRPRNASIIAWDDVEALYLPGGSWKQFLAEHPRADNALMSNVADMLDRQADKNVESELAVEQRLAKGLTELTESGLGEQTGEGVVILRKVSQQDLAELIGAKIDSVKKIIRLFKASGIIDTGRQVITILQPDTLREIAAGNRTVS
jgi:CRP/FNR family transcriptional regulator, cyclic AMP receptor protein